MEPRTITANLTTHQVQLTLEVVSGHPVVHELTHRAKSPVLDEYRLEGAYVDRLPLRSPRRGYWLRRTWSCLAHLRKGLQELDLELSKRNTRYH
ncbi:MAG: hypothetical protein JNL05_13030 [Flavobacteriales bacterium]|nr:hypothetical protein [Flavobacteriales bacterium]